MAAATDGGSQSPDALVDDIEKTRVELAHSIDALVDRAHPKNIAQRQLARLKGAFVTPDGSVRVDSVAKVAGAVVGLVAVVVAIRKIAG